MKSTLVSLTDVSKSYGENRTRVCALQGVNLQIVQSELMVVLGPSGCGKTTLLNVIGGMEHADSGSIYFDGQDLGRMNENQLTQYRRYQMGFIFQSNNLMPNLTALQNVQYIAEIVKNPLDPMQELERVGFAKRCNHYPAELSIGEQQRVAIARALVKNPRLILADEPTAALDVKSCVDVLRLLEQVVRERGCTLVMVTHNNDIVPMANRVVYMKDGRITEIRKNEKPLSVNELQL